MFHVEHSRGDSSLDISEEREDVNGRACTEACKAEKRT
jgi:hypothetical protein